MLKNVSESTRRTIRTVLQSVGAFATFLVGAAIPPVGDAINSILGLVPGVDIAITPGIIAAVGVVGTALVALVTKLQNLAEGRDTFETPEQLADEILELSALVDALVRASKDAGVEVKDVLHSHGFASLETSAE